ncbi:Gfo/Idh/MocA family oxidoreductase [Puniceicoccaceae bacterium K14]|nr:Gfo/Idh/MocA family oxidoreductase [Puniceicoccaceae bacterium K14]
MRLRASVIGLGPAGRGFHLGAWTFIKDTVPTCVFDPDPATAELKHVTKKKCRHYTDLDRMFEEEDIDVLSISSPPQFHLEQAQQAVRHGIRNLIIEKPLVTSVEELEGLRELESQYGAKICPIHNFKYQPGIQSIYNSFDKGELGEILHIERTWLKCGDVARMISDEKHWSHALPGGRWGETMAHDLYTAMPLLGRLELVHVDARKTTGKWPWLSADEVTILLRGKKQRGTLMIRYSANQQENLFKHMTVHGSKAIAYTDGMRALQTIWPYPADETLPFTSPEKYVSGHYPLMGQAVEFFLGRTDERPISWEEAGDVVKLTSQIGAEIEQQVGYSRT